jgi:hypothetical protein
MNITNVIEQAQRWHMVKFTTRQMTTITTKAACIVLKETPTLTDPQRLEVYRHIVFAVYFHDDWEHMPETLSADDCASLIGIYVNSKLGVRPEEHSDRVNQRWKEVGEEAAASLNFGRSSGKYKPEQHVDPADAAESPEAILNAAGTPEEAVQRLIEAITSQGRKGRTATSDDAILEALTKLLQKQDEKGFVTDEEDETSCAKSMERHREKIRRHVRSERAFMYGAKADEITKELFENSWSQEYLNVRQTPGAELRYDDDERMQTARANIRTAHALMAHARTTNATAVLRRGLRVLYQAAVDEFMGVAVMASYPQDRAAARLLFETSMREARDKQRTKDDHVASYDVALRIVREKSRVFRAGRPGFQRSRSQYGRWNNNSRGQPQQQQQGNQLPKPPTAPAKQQ